MNSVRRTTVAAAMGVVFTAATLAVAGPAFAYGVGSCMDKKLACIWEDPGGQGSEYGHGNCNCRWDIGGINGHNEISSAGNYTRYCMRLWNNDNWTGSYIDIPPNSERLNLAGYGFDNKAESWQLYSC
jgi:hypothetical protein